MTAAITLAGVDKKGFDDRLREVRKQLETERRIMVLLKNGGCNAVPNPNDYVFDWSPLLEGPYKTYDDQEWKYSDEDMLASEPYLIMEAIDGEAVRLPNSSARRHGGAACARHPSSGGGRVGRLAPTFHCRRQPLGVGFTRTSSRPTSSLAPTMSRPSSIWAVADSRSTANGPSLGRPPRATALRSVDLGGAVLTPAADSYTVGSTLYHLITGQAPLELLPPNPAPGNRAVPFDRWGWARLKERVSARTYQFIRDCLDPRPGNRPKDGSEGAPEDQHAQELKS